MTVFYRSSELAFANLEIYVPSYTSFIATKSVLLGSNEGRTERCRSTIMNVAYL